MFEVEIKRRLRISYDEICSRISKLGGVMVSEVYEDDIYFNHPCRNFKVTDEALRVRICNGKVYLTYKGPKAKVKGKVRYEKSIECNNLNDVIEILEKLGFKMFMRVSKRRVIYKLGKFTVNIDDIKGLGRFVEVEAILKSKTEVNKVLRLCEELLDKLGVRGRNIKRSYLELLLSKRQSSLNKH